MDYAAGLPIVVASLVALVLLSWLHSEHRAIERYLRLYRLSNRAELTAGMRRMSRRVRSVVLWSTATGPAIMLFSGQLDAHGIAQIFNGSLQIIAPFTSACFSAAVAWLLITSPAAVHTMHCKMLEAFFRRPNDREELW